MWTCSILVLLILYIDGYTIAFSVLCILKGNTPSAVIVIHYYYPYLTREDVEIGGNGLTR